MSINPLGNVSNIWSRATTALTTTTDPTTLPPTTPPADQDKTGTMQTAAAGTPFQKLSSDLQAVLLQMQSGQGTQPNGSTTQNGTLPSAGRGHHGHHAPQSTATSALSAVA